jgi:hypothetical protein
MIVEKPPRNSAGFWGGGQGLSWAVEGRKETLAALTQLNGGEEGVPSVYLVFTFTFVMKCWTSHKWPLRCFTVIGKVDDFDMESKLQSHNILTVYMVKLYSGVKVSIILSIYNLTIKILSYLSMFHVFVTPIRKGIGKIKLPLCLTKHHAMKTYWRSGDITPHILWPQH